MSWKICWTGKPLTVISPWIWPIIYGTFQGEALKLSRYDAVKNTYSKLPHDTFLKGSLIENYEHVNVYDGQAVVGTEEGFSLVRFSSTAVGKEKLSLQIRRVYLTGRRDSLIYGRSYHYTDSLVTIPL